MPASAAPQLDPVRWAPLSRSGGRSLPSRLLVAVLAGVLVGLAFEPHGWWPLLAVALPAFSWTVFGSRLRLAFGRGYGFGLGLLVVAISWVHVLGWWVAALLIAVMAVFFGLLGVAIALSSRLRRWPVAAAGSWALIEFAYSHVPFGGFGWTRLAYAVVDTPLAGFFPIVGVPAVSALVALLGQLLLWSLQSGRPGARSRSPRPTTRRAALLAATLAGTVLLGAALQRYQPEPAAGRAGSVRVGIVQGNVPGRGIEALGRARSVTNNHLAETVDLATRWRLGQIPEPDFLLWPENSTDIDPMRDQVTYQTVQTAATVAGKPILVGAVTQGPGPDERQTTALWWDPQREVTATYAKRNLVPFGEWIPFRRQLLPLLPILKQVGAQSVPGNRPGVLSVPLGADTLRVGEVICFELAYDATVHSVLTGGAQVLVVQSNNATYGGTGQIEQQFAITRARAMEARREIAVATTNSVSGFIDRDGRVVQRTAEFTASSSVVTMPRRSALTPAITLSPWFEGLAAALGLLGVLQGAAAGRWPRARRRIDVGQDEDVALLPDDAFEADEGRRELSGSGPR